MPLPRWSTVSLEPCGCSVIVQPDASHPAHTRRELHCLLHRWKADDGFHCPVHPLVVPRCLSCLGGRGGASTSYRKRLAARRNLKTARVARWPKTS
jgi:hypothetical protein